MHQSKAEPTPMGVGSTILSCAGSYFFRNANRRRCFVRYRPAIIAPVESKRSESGSGVVPTVPVPTNSSGATPFSKINISCPPGSPDPPEKNKLSIPPEEVQVALGKTLAGFDVGQSKVRLPRPGNVRSRLMKVLKVSLNTIRHPSVGPLGSPSRAQVAAVKVTANGAEESATTHREGLEKHIFGGSRTCTWKSISAAQAWLVTPQNRAITNKHTTRKYFISVLLRRWARDGAETVHSKIEFGEKLKREANQTNIV